MHRTAMVSLSLILAGGLTVFPTAAATDPGVRGPFTVGLQNQGIPVEGGATRSTDIYHPASGGGVDPAAGRCPVVVFGHGFSRNKDRYNDFGEHLASRGYIVLIADFVCGIFTGCDHDRNANEMSDLIDWIVAKDSDPASIFFGRVATNRLGTSGHSAGGLQALVCASRDARVGASAPMDPVDNNGLGVGSLPATRIPIAVTYSEPSSCNANGSSVDLYNAANPQKRGAKLVGANHCDPEKNNDVLGCALTCGAWNSERHTRYLRYVTGWFEYFLKCDGAYKEWAFGQRVADDFAAGRITYGASLAPLAPVGLAARRDGAGVEVTRAPVLRCQGVDFWRVYRSETPGAGFVLVADALPVGATTWRDETAQSGRAYYYRARDVFGDFQTQYESPDSSEASVGATTTPGEASAANSPLLARREAGSLVDVTYAQAPCATDHAAFWGQSAGLLTGSPAWQGVACGLGVSGAASFDLPAPAPGAFAYFVVVGNDGAAEGSYGRYSTGAERTESTGLPVCDFPQVLEGC